MTRRVASLVLATVVALPAFAGDVVGTVHFRGTPPPSAPRQTTKDRAVCGDEVRDESLLVNEGGLANVVVVIQGAPPGPLAQAKLDQERCRYRPHVQVAPLGSTLEILNSDSLLHSVHGWAGKVTRFDVVTPSKGMRVPTKLDRPGLIEVRCDVHAWMVAYIVVADGPAAVSSSDGTFRIPGVPPGTYTVKAWHERLGEQTAQVAVPANGTVRMDLAYGG